MTDEKKKKLGFWEGVDRGLTGLMAVPVFGIVIKGVLENVAAEGGEIVKNKIKGGLGMSTAQAKMDPKDEIVFGAATNKLEPAEKAEITEFEFKLRETDEDRAEAFVLFVATIVKVFEVEHRRKQGKKKSDSSDDVDNSVHYRDITQGIEQANIFIRDLLARKGGTPEETFQERIKFLKGKHVFALISKKKPPAPIVLAAKEKAKQLGQKVLEEQKDNLVQHKTSASAFKERSYRRLEDTLKKKGWKK